MMRSIIALFFIFICAGSMLHAQEFSNKGKDFWLGYGYHIRYITGTPFVNAQEMILYFTADQDAIVKVEIPAVGYSKEYRVPANQVTKSLPIPKSGSQDARLTKEGKFNTGIHVTSNKSIVAYAHIYNSSVSGASLLFPTNTLGKEYYSVNFTQKSNEPNSNSFFFIVATQDNTQIEITPSATNLNGLEVGVPSLPITLNKGEIFNVMGTTTGNTGTDLTGSKIRSIAGSSGACKPIAVFSGAGKISIGGSGNGSADNLFAQAFPSNAWGTKYLTTPTGSQPNNFYRVCVKNPNTLVTLNGVDLPRSSLINNFYYEFKNSGGVSAPAPNLIQSDQPVLVAQYITTQGQEGNSNSSSGGDPEMIYLSPVEQTINNITLYSASDFQILNSYINIVIKKEGVASFRLDGVAPALNTFLTHPREPNYSYAIMQVANGTHLLYSDSGFNAIAYGFGTAESYGYNAGTNIIDLNPPITLKNQFSSTSVTYSATCTNTSFNINLALTYNPNKIVIDMGGNDSLTGLKSITYNPSPTGFDSTYIANGKKYYQYRLTQLYSYKFQGNFPVKITTTSDLPQSDGCSNTNEQEIIDNIIVNDPPTANFNITSNGCINNQIAFTDASDGIGRPMVKWIWTFSDATSSELQNPNKIFATPGNYTAKLISITDYGCVASITKDIKVSNKPIAAFTVQAPICEKSSISFTDASTIVAGPTANTIAQWRWNLDNGSGVVAANTNAAQSFTYTNWGAKNVYLVAESNTGCISDTFRIAGFKINPLPEVGFILPEVCLADAAAPFQDTSKIADGSAASLKHLWKFDDGVSTVDPLKRPSPLSLTTLNPAPSYKSVGNYTVSLTVTSNNGCITSVSKPFTVNGSIPIPKFEVQQNNPLCSNDSIRIKNLSTVDFGTITRLDIFWDTLNKPAAKSPDENPYINKQYAVKYNNFSAPDSIPYTISLVAFSGNSSACSRSIKKIIYVKNSPAVAFSDIRDICYDAAPRQLDQGSFSSALTASGNYYGKGISVGGLLNPLTTGVGNDTLKYLVVNSAGCRDSAFQPLTVWPSPIAKWGVSSPLCEKNNIPFTDSSLANFSNISLRKWDFGDGSTEIRNTSDVFTHRFDTAKNYTVSLSVVTDSGCISTLNSQPLITKDLPKPSFGLPIICLPDGRGIFTNTSKIADGSDALFRYEWNFGDPNNPTPSLLKVPTHKYSALGPYNVQLKVTSKDGCIDSLTKVLNTIYPWPKASFNLSAAAICLGDSIKFTDMGDGISSPPNTWRWNFGDGKLSSSQNPTNTYTDSGSFNIRYFFFNGQGCVSDTVSKTVIVHPYPKLILGPKINVLEGGTAAIKPKYIYGTDLSYLWTPTTYLNNPIDSIPKTTPLSDFTYRLNLTGIGGCTVTDTIFIKLLLPPIVPNAFSPNGDGINDRWRIQYLESYPGATVQVFNRYGQVVFSSFEYSVDWDGKLNGKPLPIGTYYYIVDPKNGRNKITGSITIVL